MSKVFDAWDIATVTRNLTVFVVTWGGGVGILCRCTFYVVTLFQKWYSASEEKFIPRKNTVYYCYYYCCWLFVVTAVIVVSLVIGDTCYRIFLNGRTFSDSGNTSYLSVKVYKKKHRTECSGCLYFGFETWLTSDVKQWLLFPPLISLFLRIMWNTRRSTFVWTVICFKCVRKVTVDSVD